MIALDVGRVLLRRPAQRGLVVMVEVLRGFILVLADDAVHDLRTVALDRPEHEAFPVQTGRRLLDGSPWTPISAEGWLAVAGLTVLPTIAARLLVFAGLRNLGGAQTSLLGLAELFVALLIAFVGLGERLTSWQWLGGLLLITSVLLGSRESNLEVSWDDLLREGRWRELG